MVHSRAPLSTEEPLATATEVMVPSWGAMISFSIFMASRIISTSPDLTAWPAVTFTSRMAVSYTHLHTGHVVDGGAVQVAARQLLLVVLNHFAGLAGLLAKAFQLFLRAVNPDDLVGGDQLLHFVKPSQHGLIVGHLY